MDLIMNYWKQGEIIGKIDKLPAEFNYWIDVSEDGYFTLYYHNEFKHCIYNDVCWTVEEIAKFFLSVIRKNRGNNITFDKIATRKEIDWKRYRSDKGRIRTDKQVEELKERLNRL